MPKSSLSIRVAFGVAAALVVVALSLHVSNWVRQGVVNWPAAANMVGLLVLVATGVIDPPRARLRFGLMAIALMLIVPSAILLFLR